MNELDKIFIDYTPTSLSKHLEIAIEKNYFQLLDKYIHDILGNDYKYDHPLCKEIRNVSVIIGYYIFVFPNHVPYDKRYSIFYFHYGKNLDMDTFDDLITLYRKAAYDYGLRIRKCTNYYFIYWDKVHLHNKEVVDIIDRRKFTNYDEFEEEVYRFLRK